MRISYLNRNQKIEFLFILCKQKERKGDHVILIKKKKCRNFSCLFLEQSRETQIAENKVQETIKITRLQKHEFCFC